MRLIEKLLKILKKESFRIGAVGVVMVGIVFGGALFAVNDGFVEKDKIDFLSFTPNTFRQIFQDNWRVHPRKISGKLTLPPGKGPFPTVVLVHGNYHPKELNHWFKELVPRLSDAGIASFVIDSFSGRKIPDTVATQVYLPLAARLVDAFQALDVLASFEEIDEDRIGISGYSSGGTVSLLSSELRLSAAGLAKGRMFAAHLPVSPDCQIRFRHPQSTGAPLLILAAELDDWVPSRYCTEYGEKIDGSGDATTTVKIYKDTHHAWFNDHGIYKCEFCMSFRDCGRMYIEDTGHESGLNGAITTKFGWQEFITNLYQQCGSLETTMNLNQVARQDTLQTTVTFFSDTLLDKR